MKFSELQKISSLDQKRRKVVEQGLQQYDLWSYLPYLIYRIKWPILFKLITRLILLAEVTIIHQLFSYNVFGDLTLYIFIIFISRGALKGITQFFRVRLMPLVVAKNSSAINIELSKALIVNFACSLIFVLLISTLCLTLNFSSKLNGYFVLTWCLLIPLEQCTTQLWNTVYLSRRLPRSALIVASCRLLPSITLLLFGALAGPLSYIFALFLGRAIESIYLIKLAIKALDFKFTWKRKKKPFRFFRIISRYLNNKLARKYFYFNAILPCYFLGLGLIIFERSLNAWITNIIYFFSLNFAVFFTTQICRSALFDIYTTAKHGLTKKASFLARRILKLSLILSLLLVTGFISLVLFSKSFYLFIPITLEEFLLLLPLAMIAHTLFFIIYSQIQSLALDRYHYRQIASIFLLVGLPLQSFFFNYLKANLQTVYLIEIITFLLASILLYKNLNFNISPFILSRIKKARRELPLCNPETLQLQLRAQQLKTNKTNIYLIAFYERDLRLDRIKHALPFKKDLLISKYSAGLYLVSSSSAMSLEDFKSLSIVAIHQIDLNLDLKLTLLNIYKFYYALEFRNRLLQKVRNKFYLKLIFKEEIFRLAESGAPLEEIIPELKNLPRLEINRGKIVQTGRLKLKHYNLALNNYFNVNKYVAQDLSGSLLIIKKNNFNYICYQQVNLKTYDNFLISKKIFFLNQYYYFKNIIDPQAKFIASLQDYLIAQRTIHPYAQRNKSVCAQPIADLNFYNQKLI